MTRTEERRAEKQDALGRRRHPQQNRGLRPLFPKLPRDTQSRSVRIAMSGRAWERLEQMVSQAAMPTKPRSYGEVLERLLDNPPARQQTALEPTLAVFATTAEQQETTDDQAGDWQAWQMQKERALLGPPFVQPLPPEWSN